MPQARPARSRALAGWRRAPPRAGRCASSRAPSRSCCGAATSPSSSGGPSGAWSASATRPRPPSCRRTSPCSPRRCRLPSSTSAPCRRCSSRRSTSPTSTRGTWTWTRAGRRAGGGSPPTTGCSCRRPKCSPSSSASEAGCSRGSTHTRGWPTSAWRPSSGSSRTRASAVARMTTPWHAAGHALAQTAASARPRSCRRRSRRRRASPPPPLATGTTVGTTACATRVSTPRSTSSSASSRCAAIACSWCRASLASLPTHASLWEAHSTRASCRSARWCGRRHTASTCGSSRSGWTSSSGIRTRATSARPSAGRAPTRAASRPASGGCLPCSTAGAGCREARRSRCRPGRACTPGSPCCCCGRR
mmetsp:Transcript_37441/g.114974  ORF Transcript_37441/g.114974 Transcript_37441/m.114974 type:complete len:362 (-) Transcript_37441:843-1928(-)